MRRRLTIVTALLFVALGPQVFFVSCDASHSGESTLASQASLVRFANVYDGVVRPNCVRCHDSNMAVPLDSFEAIQNTLVVGQPDFSLIVEVAQSGVAPHARLGEAELALLRQWITDGAIR